MTWQEVLRKLPEANNTWSCKWFWTILWLSVCLIIAGLTIIPAFFGTIAVIVGGVVGGYVVGMRQDGASCNI